MNNDVTENGPTNRRNISRAFTAILAISFILLILSVGELIYFASLPTISSQQNMNYGLLAILLILLTFTVILSSVMATCSLRMCNMYKELNIIQKDQLKRTYILISLISFVICLTQIAFLLFANKIAIILSGIQFCIALATFLLSIIMWTQLDRNKQKTICSDFKGGASKQNEEDENDSQSEYTERKLFRSIKQQSRNTIPTTIEQNETNETMYVI